MISKGFSANFYHLILGRSSRNIADSIYFVSLSVGLVTVYDIQAGQLSLFTLIGLLPNLMAFLYGGFFNRIKRDKFWLVIFQLAQLMIILATIYCLRQKLAVQVMFLLNFLFSLSTNLLNTLQMKIVPETLGNDEEIINKSVDIQYMTSNALDIASNFVASILLGVMSYYTLFNLSLPFFVFAIYFMLKLRLPRQSNQFSSDMEEVKEDKSRKVLQTLDAFRTSKFASFIVVTESILSGGTDLLLTLIPLYLVSEGISIKYLGLVFAVQRAADLVGAFLAPKVKMSYRRFFFLDYMLSGLALVLVFLIPNPLVKLFLFALAFVIIGISGNMFEKMIYAEYDYSKMGLIYSANSSLYALFGILFLLVPQFYTDITVLGLVINILTILVGVYLFFNKSGK